MTAPASGAQKDYMRYHVAVAASAISILVCASASGQTLPVRDGRPIVATVNRDTIALDELVLQLESASDLGRLRQGRATQPELDLLGRMVTSRLIFQEAQRMGLDETPEILKEAEVQSRVILRDVLTERVTRNVKPDPAVVQKVFRELVREWKTTSLLFQQEAAARRAHMEISNGLAFATVGAKAVAAKTARFDGDDGYHKRDEYLPPIAEAIAPLRAGQLGPLVRIQAGYVVVQVVDIRYPENPEALAEARNRSLQERRGVAMTAHQNALRRDYAVVHKAVLKSLDYEAPKPGIDALLKDKRVVAEIKGAAPVTVADLTDYLQIQFFHGTDKASQRRRMNERKEDALEATLMRRLLNMEARKLGLDKAPAYRDRVRGYTESLVFGAFLNKVIAPVNKLREDELKRYYDANISSYSSPPMMRVRGLAFAKRTLAEDALRKLREGADFNWLSANAPGQLPKDTQGLLTFDARPVTVESMPVGMRKALDGAKAGESRLYSSPQGFAYVLNVKDLIAPTSRSYAEVREELSKKLYEEKINRAVEEYGRKLRAQSKVETYLKRMQ